MKPTYEITNATIFNNCLWGNIKDHAGCTNGHVQMTSPILHRDTPDVGLDGNCVETENSIYHVKSWKHNILETLRSGFVRVRGQPVKLKEFDHA